MPEAVGVLELWIPILVASVAVFVASSLVWMVLPHHKHDWQPVPDEDAAMEALRKAGVKPGEQYTLPNCGGSMAAMQEPAFQEKLKQGPVAFLVVGPNGNPPMGKLLAQWFVYTLVVGTFVAYLTGRTSPAGADYLQVFRISGTVAFASYSLAVVPQSIWKNMSWSMTLKELGDGLLYAVLTAGVFGWLWPAA